MIEKQLYFYDSKKSEKIPFQPQDPQRVKIYSCGPTVYNYSHIGNIRSYLFVDVLRRTLKLFGYHLDQTMNITDIDDKIIHESIQQKTSIEEFTQPWIERFFEDLNTLNIERVEHYPRATESIDEMILMIQRLQDNGLVYEKEGNIYYSIDKFSDYGALSKIDTSGMKTGARYDADEYDKDNARDFVLWKAPKEEGEKFWDSKFGRGRPGWHLECSAMIRGIYNSGVDIHTGGIDLLFPHHENEIAQTQGAYPNETFVNYWLHCEHLLVDGQKMSKSKGNFYVLKDILNQGYSWKEVRYVLLSFHYRTKLNFSWDRLKEARLAIEKIQNALNRILELGGKFNLESKFLELFSTKDLNSIQPMSIGKEYFENFLIGLADDLNTPKALASVFESLKSINIHIDKESLDKEACIDTFKYFCQIQGLLGILEIPRNHSSDTDSERLEIESLIQERTEAKKAKNFSRADEIRDELKKRGIQIEDSKDGSVKWKRIQ